MEANLKRLLKERDVEAGWLKRPGDWVRSRGEW